jgi:hypothetical protein
MCGAGDAGLRRRLGEAFLALAHASGAGQARATFGMLRSVVVSSDHSSVRSRDRFSDPQAHPTLA